MIPHSDYPADNLAQRGKLWPILGSADDLNGQHASLDSLPPINLGLKPAKSVQIPGSRKSLRQLTVNLGSKRWSLIASHRRQQTGSRISHSIHYRGEKRPTQFPNVCI
jgi:hypothetical protein